MPKGVYLHRPKPLADRFWSKVSKGVFESCWEWMAFRDEHGRGQFGIGRLRKYKAHRIAWQLTHGAIPQGMLVCHSCDNPSCCNPAHLFLGTHKDNSLDAERKGRLYHYWPQFGKDHPCAKVFKDVRDAIRQDPRSHRTLAKAFCVSKTTVTRIKNEAGGNW